MIGDVGHLEYMLIIFRVIFFLSNNQIDAIFHVFIYSFISSHLYMFRASSVHHQEIELY